MWDRGCTFVRRDVATGTSASNRAQVMFVPFALTHPRASGYRLVRTSRRSCRTKFASNKVLSKEGTTVAVGSFENNAIGEQSAGKLRVFCDKSNYWRKIGNSISEEVVMMNSLALVLVPHPTVPLQRLLQQATYVFFATVVQVNGYRSAKISKSGSVHSILAPSTHHPMGLS